MSLFKRANSPFWQTEIQVNNRRLIRSTGTTSRREAEAYERRLRETAKQEVGSASRTARAVNITVDEMFGRYWLEHGSKLRWAANVAAYSKRIVAVLGPTKVAQLSQVDCAALIETFRQEEMGKVSINRAVSVLRAAHGMAGKQWGCPIQMIDWRSFRTREAKERVRWLTREEAARLVSNLPDHISLIVEWSLYTGLRKRETLGLDREAVSAAKGTAEVLVKGGHTRTVQLSLAARDVLARAPMLGTGKIFDGTNLRKHFVKGCAKAGIKDFHFHDLRHTFATWMRQEGASIEIVSRALGHSSIHVTQKYAHVDDREVLAASNAIGLLAMSNVVPLAGARRNAKSRHAGRNAGM